MKIPIHLPDCSVIKEELHPSTVSLTPTLSQGERESFSVLILTHPTKKALRMFYIRVNRFEHSSFLRGRFLLERYGDLEPRLFPFNPAGIGCRRDSCTTLPKYTMGYALRANPSYAYATRITLAGYAALGICLTTASLTLTLSQREREIILLSSFSQGLRPGLCSCRAVGAQKQHCKPVNSYLLLNQERWTKITLCFNMTDLS